ncbi:class II aldolase and Adducin N-terminal domain-containing protein [Immersiella caudata]|uniref:Class II aldolase and Adducin N-terminal domain-containing protein n=1 Tax=Immersiella caudata TaxID=314043 RepID=A0AA40C1F6_9PEZI|nr:class II aldolase and Adducin N-terminal domain-containing protein [Immersiella caudata]
MEDLAKEECLNTLEKMEPEYLHSSYRKLIDGNHILHHHGLFDAYGHLSMRNPLNPSGFIMARKIAPATLSSPENLIEYDVSCAESFDPGAPEGFVERRIHSEVYKRHPEVNAIIHGHSEAIAPYTITNIPLRACYHMAGFLGPGAVPVYDSAQHRKSGDTPDLLISNENLAYELAKNFDDGNVVTLMRGHGLTVVAQSVELAVLRAIYTKTNAAIQTAAMSLCGMAGKGVGEIHYLDEDEAEAAANMTWWSGARPWKLWIREVEASGLYVNHA